MSQKKEKKGFFYNIYRLFAVNKPFFLELYKKHKWAYVFTFIVSPIIYGLDSLLFAYSGKAFLDEITLHDNLVKALFIIVAYIVYKYIIYNFFEHVEYSYYQYAFSHAQLVMKEKILHHFSKVYMSYYDDPDSYNTLQLALRYANGGGSQLVGRLSFALTNIITLGSMLYVFSQLQWWIVVIIGIVTIFNMILENLINKLNQRYIQIRTHREREISYYAGAVLTKDNQEEFKIYNGFQFLFNKYKKAFKSDIKLRRKEDIKLYMLTRFMQIGTILVDLLTYLYVGWRMVNGDLTAGDYVLFTTALGTLNQLFAALQSEFTSWGKLILFATPLFKFLNSSEHERTDCANWYQIPQKGIACIEFKHVDFSYAGKSEKVLKDITFKVSKGEKVAIVGVNGAGKTTLIKLLMSLYEPQNGQVFINDHDIRQIHCEDLWNHIGAVFQTHREYPISIAENVLMDTYTAKDASKVWEALDKVGLKEKVEMLPKKLDTPLTRLFRSDGTDFSGGERQRLAIARIFVKNCDVLILDEPAASLDAIAEKQLYDSVKNVSANETVFFISHRLSSVLMADRIMYINEGRIEAFDRHEVLMQTCPGYAKLFNVQADKYRKGMENYEKQELV